MVSVRGAKRESADKATHRHERMLHVHNAATLGTTIRQDSAQTKNREHAPKQINVEYLVPGIQPSPRRPKRRSPDARVVHEHGYLEKGDNKQGGRGEDGFGEGEGR